jgi:hypothetical protein
VRDRWGHLGRAFELVKCPLTRVADVFAATAEIPGVDARAQAMIGVLARHVLDLGARQADRRPYSASADYQARESPGPFSPESLTLVDLRERFVRNRAPQELAQRRPSLLDVEDQ